MYLCKDDFYNPEVGDTHIWILQLVNPIAKGTLLKIHHTGRSTNQHSLMFHTLLIQRLSFVLITPNFYLWNRVSLLQQPLHNHHARLLQLCKVVNTLHKLPQPCDNLVTTLQGCSKVTTTQLFLYVYTQNGRNHQNANFSIVCQLILPP